MSWLVTATLIVDALQWNDQGISINVFITSISFFTARCTLVKSAVLRLHVVRPSVRPSVTLVDQDHIGWKSSKLTARSISPTPSLFVSIHLLPGEHGEILGRLEVEWEKVVCWSAKAAISLMRKDRWKVRPTMDQGPIGTHQRSFERYHPRPHTGLYRATASHSQDWGFATPTQNCNRYYLRNVWSCWLQIWPIHSRGPSEQKPMKIGERGSWAYPGTVQIF